MKEADNRQDRREVLRMKRKAEKMKDQVKHLQERKVMVAQEAVRVAEECFVMNHPSHNKMLFTPLLLISDRFKLPVTGLLLR